jgi:hypothetical protein
MSTDLALTADNEIVRHHDPEAEVAWASECAKALVRVIDSQPSMKVKIGKGDYIKVEGWQVLGAMTKVDSVRVEWTREYKDPATGDAIGWEARVQVADRDGNVRGEGEASCLRTEANWKQRDDFALRSMAQTRAMGKAYRMALSYIVGLAGYQTTPAEEMPEPATKSSPKPSTKKITADQQKRLWTIARANDVPEDRIREIVRAAAGVESTKDITQERYDLVIEGLEAQGRPF